MIRILKITGPIRFGVDFDQHPQAKHIRKIVLTPPIDVKLDDAFFFGVRSRALCQKDGVYFTGIHRSATFDWFVPCEYDCIEYTHIPTADDLRYFGCVIRRLDVSPSRLVHLTRAEFGLMPFDYFFGTFRERKGAVWLLDAFVWCRRIVDGDNAIATRVLRFLLQETQHS